MQTRLATTVLALVALLLAAATASSASPAPTPGAVYRTLANPATWRAPPRPYHYVSVGTFGRLTRFGVGTALVEYAHSGANTHAPTERSAVVVEVIESPRRAQSWLTSIKAKNGATAIPSTPVYRWVTAVTGGYEPNMAMRVGFVVVIATGEKTRQRPPRAAWKLVRTLLAFATARSRAAQR